MEHIWYFGGTENFHTNLTWNGFVFGLFGPFRRMFHDQLANDLFRRIFQADVLALSQLVPSDLFW